MGRKIADTGLKVTGTLPNAANTTYSNVIDLEATTPYPVTESLGLRIAISTATGANNKNINIRLQDSATNNSSNFTNVTGVANPLFQSTDNNGAGHSASNSANYSFPPHVKRYIRLAALGEANGGNSSDGTFTLELLG